MYYSTNNICMMKPRRDLFPYLALKNWNESPDDWISIRMNNFMNWGDMNRNFPSSFHLWRFGKHLHHDSSLQTLLTVHKFFKQTIFWRNYYCSDFSYQQNLFFFWLLMRFEKCQIWRSFGIRCTLGRTYNRIKFKLFIISTGFLQPFKY